MRNSTLFDLEQQGMKSLLSVASTVNEKLRGGFSATHHQFFKLVDKPIKIDPDKAMWLARMGK